MLLFENILIFVFVADFALRLFLCAFLGFDELGR